MAVRCRALDGSGAPLAGVRVSFAWRLPGGVVVDRRTTGADGVAFAAHTWGELPPVGRAKVRVTADYRGQAVTRTLALSYSTAR